MENVKSFHLARSNCSPEIKTHENFSILSLFAISCLMLIA